MDKERFIHSFIFTPGSWYGEGKIVLNMVEEELIFNTNWTVQNRDFSGKVGAAQEIQIQGLSENMRNELTFYDLQSKTFSVDMENPNIGRITGTGLYDDQSIAWEFRNNDMNFEGYETYSIQSDGSYQMRGEYVTSDQFRTRIEARIWQRTNEVPSSEEEQDSEGDEES